MILVGSANRSPTFSSFNSFLGCLHVHYDFTFTLEIRMKELSVIDEGAMSMYQTTWKCFEDFEEIDHIVTKF